MTTPIRLGHAEPPPTVTRTTLEHRVVRADALERFMTLESGRVPLVTDECSCRSCNPGQRPAWWLR